MNDFPKGASGSWPARRRLPSRRAGAILAWAVLPLLLGVPALARAQTILDVRYSAAQDALVVEIAYQGTNPNHEFSLVWDGCQQAGEGRHVAVGRLIDSQGNDVAKTDFQVRRRLSLAALTCRPAEVTIRLGPVSNRTVSVPAAGK
jgi:hypothetical protein